MSTGQVKTPPTESAEKPMDLSEPSRPKMRTCCCCQTEKAMKVIGVIYLLTFIYHFAWLITFIVWKEWMSLFFEWLIIVAVGVPRCVYFAIMLNYKFP